MFCSAEPEAPSESESAILVYGPAGLPFAETKTPCRLVSPPASSSDGDWTMA